MLFGCPRGDLSGYAREWQLSSEALRESLKREVSKARGNEDLLQRIAHAEIVDLLLRSGEISPFSTERELLQGIQKHGMYEWTKIAEDCRKPAHSLEQRFFELISPLSLRSIKLRKVSIALDLLYKGLLITWKLGKSSYTLAFCFPSLNKYSDPLDTNKS